MRGSFLFYGRHLRRLTRGLRPPGWGGVLLSLCLKARALKFACVDALMAKSGHMVGNVLQHREKRLKKKHAKAL